MVNLGVNIDHVATIRQARRGDEPDPLGAAHEAEMGGAEIITVHLREDRRHIQDRDVQQLVRFCKVRVNLEMGATDEMVGIALQLRAKDRGPQMCTLVPEKRQELTTEGGLDVAGQVSRLRDVIARLKSAHGGMTVSAFIDAEPAQVEAAKTAGFDACEIHTGPYAAAFLASGGDPLMGRLADELRRVRLAGERIVSLGMRFNAGHALNYQNVRPIAGLSGVTELHIGHSIVSRSVYVGLREAVREMKRLIEHP